nr:immunoglobulin heavy chain junction region [Mus musculus]MBK4197599.1 immunoglobulin heavy chain junction region [Mus musculus]MBK4197600.1 immunoglobulin heavy chain junction region [Mus musculus]
CAKSYYYGSSYVYVMDYW